MNTPEVKHFLLCAKYEKLWKTLISYSPNWSEFACSYGLRKIMKWIAAKGSSCQAKCTWLILFIYIYLYIIYIVIYSDESVKETPLDWGCATILHHWQQLFLQTLLPALTFLRHYMSGPQPRLKIEPSTTWKALSWTTSLFVCLPPGKSELKERVRAIYKAKINKWK